MVEWLNRQEPRTLYLTTVNLAELLAGIETLPVGRRRDALKQALTAQMMPLFEGRILAFDEPAVAAFASAHGFMVATRNVRDFKGTGVEVLNPWQAGIS